MTYVHTPHTETLPSARERIAALRKVNEGKLRVLQPLAKSGSVGACRGMDRAEDRQFMLDVADILLDAMRYGPDGRG